MTPERYERLSDLFLRARRLPEAEREAWVRGVCGDDPTLADEAMGMLRCDGEAPLLTGAGAARGSWSEPAPERIGRYRVLGVIGEGGMGVVYRAEQDNPRRIIALKVLRPGLLTPSALRRFEHEAQVLGRLRHPGVAQILEAGSGAGGTRPFLAMEFVQGTPLTAYARSHGLGLQPAIELFVRVCDAVHHAHQRGVIHRDLKPANILVEETGQPKVVDFGIARADGEGGATMHTTAGQIIGTLPYMSPEQIGGHPEDLDTRSDVYALGVILYELLVGRLPYDVSGATILEAGRIIREQDPEPAGRSRRELAGDLQAILGKTLEKDRSRRYPSAAALADDLRHYLRHEPVTARPQTTLYQFRRFAARNKALVAGTVSVGITLLAGAVVATVLYLKAESARASLAIEKTATTHERDRALGAEALATTRLTEANEARAQSDRHAARADRVKSFLVDMFGALTPEKGNRADLTVREVVDAAAKRLKTSLNEEPEVRAETLLTIGLVYAGLDLDSDAREQLLQAAELRRTTTGPKSVEYADVLLALARLPWRTPALTREAKARCEDAVAIYRASLGDQHPKTLEALAVRMMIANQGGTGADPWAAAVDAMVPTMLALVQESDYPPDIAAVIAQTRTLLNAGDKAGVRKFLLDYRVAVTDKIVQLWGTGDREGAYAEIRRHYEPLARTPMFADLMPRTLTALAAWVEKQDIAPEAVEALYREAVNYGRAHPGTQGETYRYSALELAEYLRDHQSAQESESLYQEAARIFRATAGPKNEPLAICLFNLAQLRLDAGDAAAADGYAQEAAQIRLATLGPRSVYTLEAQTLVAQVRQGAGDLPGAESGLREVLDAYRATLAEDNWHIPYTESILGACLLDRGQIEQARPLLQHGYEALRVNPPSADLLKEARKRLDRLPDVAQAPQGGG